MLDPHGDLVTRIKNNILDHRKGDVIYLDITDPKQPYKYNPLRKVSFENRSIIVSSILEVFKKLWSDSRGWGVKLEHIMRYTLLALLNQPSADFSDIGRMLYDKFGSMDRWHYMPETVGTFTTGILFADKTFTIVAKGTGGARDKSQP